MASKYELITERYLTTAGEIAKPEVWPSFLTTACHNFRLSFDKQVLLYAQRPDATAVLPIEGDHGWNKRFGRWVNRGSKGIAMFDSDRNGQATLKYYFDIADTHETRYSRPVPIWTVQPEYGQAIVETLENHFGELERKDTLAAALISAAHNAVEDNMTDYLAELIYYKEDSYLEPLDDESIEATFKPLLQNSIAYMLMVRCGIDPAEYLQQDDFSYISGFNTLQTLNALGTAASDIFQMCLSEIARTVLPLQRQEIQNRTFAEIQEDEYAITVNKETHIERSIDHDSNHIQQAGRLSSAQPSPAPGTDDPAWEVRIDAQPVSEGASEGHIHESDDQRQAEPPSGGDRADRPDDAGADLSADGEGAGRDGGTESQRSDEVGSDDEQPPAGSRGDGSGGSNLPLSAYGSKDSKVDYYHQDEEKNELLRTCDELKNHRIEIATFFADHPDREERGIFIRDFFDNYFVEKILSNGQRAGYRAFSNFLQMWRGAFATMEREALVPWWSVAAHIEGMILMNTWLDPDERPLPTVEEQQQMILEAHAKDGTGFILPQAAIDYVIASGNLYQDGKLRIYEFFQQGKTPKENIAFLKDSYGWGGHSDAIPGSGLWEGHDAKGIEISRYSSDEDHRAEILMKWPMVEKRIRELIAADRYLSPKEKERYPRYIRERQRNEERYKIVDEFRSIIYDHNDFWTQVGDKDKCFELYPLSECWSAFSAGRKTTRMQNGDVFVLPAMRSAMEQVIAANAHHADRAKAMLEKLNGEIALPMEPTYDELNPPPPLPKEYRLSLGDTVYIGSQQYELLSLGDEEVTLFDPTFPLFHKSYPRQEFFDLLKENPLNDTHLQVITAAEQKEKASESAPAKQQLDSEAPAPAMWEYNDVKQNHPDNIVLFQMGDFYEMYGEDAKKAATILDLHLASRSIPGSGRVEMCGIPSHALNRYVKELRHHFSVTVSSGDWEKQERTTITHPAYFLFGGYHFEAIGNLPAGYNLDHLMKHEIASDPELGFSAYEGAKVAYSHKDFYDASGDSKADVFRCVDNGKLYLPGENTLFLYSGEYRELELLPEQAPKEPTIQSVYEQNYPAVRDAVLADVAYRNACINSDEQNAQIECNAAISSAINTGDWDMNFRKLYYDSGIYHQKLHREIWEETYPILTQQREKQQTVARYDPNQFSIRLLPMEGGIMGIWDSDLNRYYGEDGQLFRFAEQETAEDFLKRIQLQHGFEPDTVMTTPDGTAYRIGAAFLAGDDESGRSVGIIQSIDPDDVWYTIMDLPEQEPVQMDRNEFERNIDLGNLVMAAPTLLHEVAEAERLIADFVQQEYGKDFKMEKSGRLIPVATALTEDDLHTVTVYADLENAAIVTNMDGVTVKTEAFPDLEAMLEQKLRHLELKELTEVDMSTVPMVGKIEYLATNGTVAYSAEFLEEQAFVNEIKDCNNSGVPIMVTLYRDRDGKTISTEFVNELDAPLHGFTTTDSPYLLPVSGFREIPIQPSQALAPPAPKPKARTVATVLLPEIPRSQRHNYRITDDALGVGTPSQRYANNVAAIRLLKQLEQESRLATPEEQEVLSRYVGWGGLAACFEENHSKYLELKSLLSEEEYAAARESSLTAFYTPPVVIRAIYNAMERMNFQRGNILEPSCGVGNFLGMLPDSMKDSEIYGVELDSISGRIAQQLYQKSSIAVQGFEKTELPDSFFDAAIGNVPFGQFKVPDRQYDKHNFLIHDYFFARTLDKVRPGGIVAFITSKGTMDKENPSVRKYIAQRADLVGAIRLPNDTFKSAAGTDVTSDIIFLQKRDRMVDIEPDWVHLNIDENGLKMNQYFIDNPDMVLGKMQEISGPFGPELVCVPQDGQSLADLLSDAIQNIHAEVTAYEMDELSEDEEDKTIPALPTVRNFSYAVVEGTIYYRENSRMTPVNVSATAASRIKGLIAIRDCVRQLIDYQTEDVPDSFITSEQAKLNTLYDEFSKKYGLINSRANTSAFNADSSFCLLTSLEILDDEGNLVRKADMFYKRTIRQKVVVTSVDTASEALALSLAEKARIDITYMEELTGKTEEQIYADLQGVIFLNPDYIAESNTRVKYLPADEYLSGNVREKLAQVKQLAELHPEDFASHVQALEAVQPKDLSASEISVRLGATWLPTDVVESFVYELFGTPRYAQWKIKIRYSTITGEWSVSEKNYDRSNVKAANTYGTNRINGYKIVEETLNLKDVRIFDYVYDDSGKKTPVLNKKETAIAQGKQEMIKQAFQDWVWKDPHRRERLCKLYNEKFNSIRPREYDGSHLKFVGMNPEITLRPHQVNAIAHILYGGNTLLAHVVGAGKTFEMVAAAMESKRLGLCQKSMFVVPNHLTEQWASEFLQLYPSANILVTTKKDFEAKRRKKFCGRIATGDYDAIIIGHSQFEKIPMSIGRQRQILQQQVNDILTGIAQAKADKAENFTIKQMEKTRKQIQAKLEKLNDQSRKDDLVTFEELGVDRIFVDEAHYYKNLAAYSKMRNVAGISQTEAQKSSDLYMKCRYLDEITDGRGIIFATGTPISNSMVEMFTLQRYLQYRLLEKYGLLQLDAWASTFGETVTAIELAPEGSGYRAKTRFARFYNLPELMAMFKEVADIQTADMLKLPVPKANFHNVVLQPSEQQKEMVASLSERAERVRNKMVNSSEDNMLLITNDGRKLALDQRLLNPLLGDSETSKVNACANTVYEIWQETMETSATQLVFCDLSTPSKVIEMEMQDGVAVMSQFQNVYDDLRKKLFAKGIPEEQIAFIHDANTETQKKELFGKVRSGQVRVLLGSTQKMGAGTNVQQKLRALHHIDCPWRPSDLQQREGRIVRQGNMHDEVDIYTYVTENTFDSYLYQLVESKQKFIGQIMTSKSPVRSAEDIDETALSYAEIKALCTGNPYIKEKMDLDIVVQRLRLLKSNHLSQRYALEDQIIKEFPKQIATLEQCIAGYQEDMAHLKEHTQPNVDGFSPMEINGVLYTDKKAAGNAILAACSAMTSPDAVPLGQYRGFSMELSFDSMRREFEITMKHQMRHSAFLGTDVFGNILRLDNALSGMHIYLENCEQQLENTKSQLANAKAAVDEPFPHEEELQAKSARLDELNILLNLDKKENEIVDGDLTDDEPTAPRTHDRER